MKKSTIISKPDVMMCWKCNGERSVSINVHTPLIKKQCELCNGTGKWVENHYIIIDNKNKIAIDSDNGG
jgi:DnaJ-class molecular chaperone